MGNEPERFILYEYLQFFWRKKWWFVIIPLLLGVITAAAFSFQKKEFVGTGTVYVGDLSGPLTNPEHLVVSTNKDGDESNGNVKRDYRTLLDLDNISSYRIFVSESKKMAFEVKGSDRAEVERQLDVLVDTYKSELDEEANRRIEFTKQQINALEADVKKIETLSSSMKGIQSEESQANLALALSQSIEAKLKIDSKQKDIEFFLYPEILEKSVGEKSKYTVEAGLVAVVVGVILTIIMLMLWKYVLEARRHG